MSLSDKSLALCHAIEEAGCSEALTKCSVLASELRSEIAAEVHRLTLERDRYRLAIEQCVDWSNGRETEWGVRAENAFEFLHQALLPRNT